MNGSITFTSGVAISKDNFYIASTFDELDHWDYFSRMFIYRHNDEEEVWSHHDLDGWGRVSTAFKNNPRELLTLNCDGEIEVYTAEKEIYTNVIPKRKDNLIYGAFTCIQALGFGTYICGSGGQVYKANHDIWENMSGCLAEPTIDTNNTVKEDLLDLDKEYHGYSTYLYGISGFSVNELYICGSKNDRGFIALFDGKHWSEIPVNTPSSLHDITIKDRNDLFIVGAYGTLLQGNRHSGFKNLKNMTINSTFYSSDLYQDTLYIASEDGLYTYKDNVFKKVKEVENIKATFHVEEKDGVLWVLADKQLLRFDGKHWEIIEHPYNAKDSEEKSETLKCYAGERCPQSGNWHSHANQMQKRYFSEGEIMPEIENNAWGKTIWYMDI